jgi:hypothetical protein
LQDLVRRRRAQLGSRDHAGLVHLGPELGVQDHGWSGGLELHVQVDYPRRIVARVRVCVSMMRIWIEKGRLIQTVNAALQARLSYIEDYVIPYSLEFQLYEEDGREAKGNFRGQGTIVKRGDSTFLFLGDLERSATLAEYLVSPDPTAESERKLDDFIEGIKKGFQKGSRLPKNASYEMKDGFNEGRKLK